MFKKLIASSQKGRRSWTSSTTTISIALHGLLIAGAVYASVRVPEVVEKAEELVTFVEVAEGITHGEVVFAVDAARAAGIEVVGLVPRS